MVRQGVRESVAVLSEFTGDERGQYMDTGNLDLAGLQDLHGSEEHGFEALLGANHRVNFSCQGQPRLVVERTKPEIRQRELSMATGGGFGVIRCQIHQPGSAAQPLRHIVDVGGMKRLGEEAFGGTEVTDGDE